MTQTLDDFIARWASSGGSERANYALFLSELCAVLDLPPPDPTRPDDAQNAYVFEKSVTFFEGDGTSTVKRVDLYRRGCFVLEAKQGAEKEIADEQRLAPVPKLKRGTATRGTKGWDEAMLRARGQAEQYARALPPEEGRPPFLIVVDVGHTFELFAEFTRTGGTYVPFPDPRNHRMKLEDLRREDLRETLRRVWLDPTSLDPARQQVTVTREIAVRLARLARSLEASGHAPDDVAQFLMRSLFTFFAEDVGLLPEGGFTKLLESFRQEPGHLTHMLGDVWSSMRQGGFSLALGADVRRFNGGLFEPADVLPLTSDQIGLLIEAGRADWRHVEPAIFGTLLERALDPVERHKMGAHFTPRAYVERLVLPTVIEPLRAEWDAARAAAVTLVRQDKVAEALKELERFHSRLCQVRVLDSACGSGNFLYVTLEHLKRLEGEVFDQMEALGERRTRLAMSEATVDPHQLFGIEVNPLATAIAELVIWIGYLQWHYRTQGDAAPAEPVLKNFRNVVCRDAVLDWDRVELLPGEDGKPVTRWDGRTRKAHPVTGELVPDENARVMVWRYINPRPAEWPEVDFLVGNPPFIGNSRMRGALGDGYVEALRQAHADVPDNVDYVLYWWNHAAKLARAGRIIRFGFITTNSISQTFARRVLQRHMAAKPPLSLVFAIPDHPWVDSEEGAAVRIAMTTGEVGEHSGVLKRVVAEQDDANGEAVVMLSEQVGVIRADLTVGADVAGAEALRANANLSTPGVKLHGAGFIVDRDQAKQLGLGRVAGLEQHIREYRNGRDINQRSRDVMVIDLFGLTAEDVRRRFPEVYQWVLNRVKPERDAKSDTKDGAVYARLWWQFGKPRPHLRDMLANLPRSIATVETSKHRFFVFLDASILPDNKLVNIALDDAYFLGVLSSRIHVTWALAAGSHLGVGNDPVYVKTTCFEKYPFPTDPPAPLRARIRDLAESLDAHRKRQQALHPALTMTDMYNVLEKLRAGDPLGAKEQVVHEQGLVSVLKQHHDALDAAVFEAYGWPAMLTDAEILERLVALNTERAAEERRGRVRWLRPAYQDRAATQAGLGVEMEGGAAIDKAVKRTAWPKKLAEQAQAVREALTALGRPATSAEVARCFTGAKEAAVAELLEALVALGQARGVGGRFGV